jgi:hypothetical protein
VGGDLTLGSAALGDVLDGPKDSSRVRGSVFDQGLGGAKISHRAIRTDEPVLERLELALAPNRLTRAVDAIAVARMQLFEQVAVTEARANRARFEAVDAEEVVRPAQLVAFEVPLPGADVGGIFGGTQKGT